MGLNQEIIRQVAMGKADKIEGFNDLPTSMKMAYGFAAEELKKKENIEVIAENNLSFFQQGIKSYDDSGDKAGEALANMLKQQKENIERMEKAKQEHAEAYAKQKANEARAWGTSVGR